jgi:predicted transcriptional regulator
MSRIPQPEGAFMKTARRRKKPAVKEAVRRMLDRLPDDVTLEDIQYHIYVCQKIERGLRDMEQGRVYSQEQVEKWMNKWLAE